MREYLQHLVLEGDNDMNGMFPTNSKGSRFRALTFLVATAILWSTGGLLIKSIDANPLVIAGTRSAIAALLMLSIIRRPKLEFGWAKVGCAIAYTLTVVLFVVANKLTTAANAILLQYTAPIFVALFSARFLGEKIGWFDWTVIGIVLGGMGVFFLDKLSSGHFWGNLIAICGGVSFAGVALFLRKQKDESPLESIFWGNVLTAGIGLPFLLGASPSPMGWGYLIIMGVFQLGLSYILYTAAIKHVTALEAILVPVLEPILNPIWVFLFIGEKPGHWALIGGTIVLVAVTVRCVMQALKENQSNRVRGLT